MNGEATNAPVVNQGSTTNVENPIRRPNLRPRKFTMQIGLMVSEQMWDRIYNKAINEKCSMQDVIRGFIDLGFQNETN